jgi:iron complex outermembrane receptor protein/hemoglobin/transferrin/lactoferrin receptor protein
LSWQPLRRHRFTAAYYDYRQFDAPRTDRCPPPTAPADECLTYDEQFRTLVYGAYEGVRGPAAAEDTRLTLSYQRQHEDRSLVRGTPANTEIDGVDDVHSVGTALRMKTKDFELAPWAGMTLLYGTDTYYDRIASESSLVFTDVDISSALSRGQYLDGAQYVTSGVWTELQTRLGDALRLRAGGRAAVVHAEAEADPSTESVAIDRTWVTGVGNAGISARAVSWLSFVFNVDQGFRAPNLDDLTSRQQTGPGFQFENAALDPERSLSLEGGMKVRHTWVELDAFVFRTAIRDLIQRAPRTVEDCPMGDTGCGASQTRFQLVNLAGTAVIYGAEAGLRLYLPYDLAARATIAYARGEGPNAVADATSDQPERLPLSRIPPLNGTAEFGWRSRRFGVHAMGALRWARSQTRLALQDVADPRIPAGGTPGYVVFDLRAGYRLDPHVLLALVFENVGDTAYRYHGSSVNGPGRGAILEVQFGF